jgi:hypothetical protein
MHHDRLPEWTDRPGWPIARDEAEGGRRGIVVGSSPPCRTPGRVLAGRCPPPQDWGEPIEAARQDRHGSGPPYWRARILARLGERDEALGVIERLLAGPSLFSVHELRISPDFDSLRDHPRYQALLR